MTENTINESGTSIPEKNPIEKLKEGIFLSYCEAELDFPGYHAMGSMPDEIKPLQDQWRYASEILRVLSELELTLWLLENRSPTDEEIKDISHNPEDVIIYYQGFFLELIHQLRDKVLRLVALLLAVSEPSSGGSETFIKRLITAAEEQNIPIVDELKAWSDDPQLPKNGIITVLRMRTQHHHFFSGLGGHDGFLDAKISRTFSQEAAQKILTPYGKERMAAIGAEGFHSLLSTARKNAKKTLGEVQESVHSLAKKLINHFSLTLSPERLMGFSAKQEAFAERIKIQNECTLEKVPASWSGPPF